MYVTLSINLRFDEVQLWIQKIFDHTFEMDTNLTEKATFIGNKFRSNLLCKVTHRKILIPFLS